MVRERDRYIQRQGYLDIAIVLEAMVLVSCFLLFHRRISLLISFNPSLKLAIPGIPVPTRITQSCCFLPMIDITFLAESISYKNKSIPCGTLDFPKTTALYHYENVQS